MLVDRDRVDRIEHRRLSGSRREHGNGDRHGVASVERIDRHDVEGKRRVHSHDRRYPREDARIGVDHGARGRFAPESEVDGLRRHVGVGRRRGEGCRVARVDGDSDDRIEHRRSVVFRDVHLERRLPHGPECVDRLDRDEVLVRAPVPRRVSSRRRRSSRRSPLHRERLRPGHTPKPPSSSVATSANSNKFPSTTDFSPTDSNTGARFTESSKSCDPSLPARSETTTETENGPVAAPGGVQERTPVSASIVIPAGELSSRYRTFPRGFLIRLHVVFVKCARRKRRRVGRGRNLRIARVDDDCYGVGRSRS